MDEDLSPLGKCHNQALHITVKALGMSIPYVLVDNGSTISVCPLKILMHLGVDIDNLKESPMMVRAYDNSKRDALGSIVLDLSVDPV